LAGEGKGVVGLSSTGSAKRYADQGQGAEEDIPSLSQDFTSVAERGRGGGKRQQSPNGGKRQGATQLLLDRTRCGGKSRASRVRPSTREKETRPT